MASNTAGFSKISYSHPPKRKLVPELNSAADEDLQSLGNDASEQVRQLKSKNRELEARIDNMNTQIQNLQQQYRELESRINGFERRSHHGDTVNLDMRRQISDPGRSSRETKPSNLDVE